MNWLRSISLSLLRVIYDTSTRGRATDSRLPTAHWTRVPLRIRWGGGAENWAGWSQSQMVFHWNHCGDHTNAGTMPCVAFPVNKWRLGELKSIRSQHFLDRLPTVTAHLSHICPKRPGCVSSPDHPHFITLLFISFPVQLLLIPLTQSKNLLTDPHSQKGTFRGSLIL